MSSIFICKTDDIPPGTAQVFHPEGMPTPILCANKDGEILLTTALCPHEDVLFEGDDLEGETLTCSGHGYEFDLRSGRCLHDGFLRLVRYRSKVENGDVFLGDVILGD